MKQYRSEAEFLEEYNPRVYPPFATVTDILVFGITSEDDINYKKLDTKKLCILLKKRDNYPFKDKWCLPGGFVKENENLEDAPKRILSDEFGIDNSYIEQLSTLGSVKRDPRMRIISTSYIALIDKTKYQDLPWFDIEEYDESEDSIKLVLSNQIAKFSFEVEKRLEDKTTNKFSYSIKENYYLAFDNPLVIINGIKRLKNKIEDTDIVFNLMPTMFTIGELQKVYELILGKKLLDPAFRRIIVNKIQETDFYKTGEGHRPSRLFRHKE